MYGHKHQRPQWGMHASDGQWNDIHGGWRGPAVYKSGAVATTAAGIGGGGQPYAGRPLVLTRRGSGNQCVFSENKARVLRNGGAVILSLESHPGGGIGKKYLQEQRHGPWRYIESAGCSQHEAISVRYEDGKFIKLTNIHLSKVNVICFCHVVTVSKV